jgi:hypothetical protein
MSRLLRELRFDGGADEGALTPPHTISTSLNVHPIVLHSKLGFSRIWDGAVAAQADVLWAG